MADPSKFFEIEDFERNLTQDIEPNINNRFANQAWGLSSCIEDRITHIRQQLQDDKVSLNDGDGNCNQSNGGYMLGMGIPGNGECLPCGDGIYDGFETNNLDICPRDCVSEDRDWCGDGICDDLESCMRTCSEDCD